MAEEESNRQEESKLQDVRKEQLSKKSLEYPEPTLQVRPIGAQPLSADKTALGKSTKKEK